MPFTLQSITTPRPFSVFSLFLLLVWLLSADNSSAQRTPPGDNGRITARILAEHENIPVEYASVVLHRHRDSSMVGGTVSNEQGRISLDNIPPGRYFLSIHFLGYDKVYIDDVRMEAGETRDIGDVHLRLITLEMEEVEVAADRAPVEYKIDKKVINVDRQLTAASGTAVDALQNVPSVTVDLDGTVRLRGSGSFTVLIDGQPSALDASDALQQIPASSIENIEIITNPSARYDPDGIAGIINVIMKKDQRRGTAGQINISAGTHDNYRGDFLYTWRNNGYALHFGADYGKRNNPGIEREERVFYSPESTLFNYSEGSNYRRRESFGLRGGIDITLSERDQLNFGVRLGGRGFNRNAELDYEEWTEPGTDRFSYLSFNDAKREGRFYALDLDYRHRFDRPRHELTTQISWRSLNAEERNTDELRDPDRSPVSGRRATEDGPGERLQARIDYVLPFNETDRFESGYQATIHESQDITTLSEYNTDTDSYILLPAYGHTTTYFRNVQAAYSIYAMEIGSWGLQAGVRGEFTDRLVTLEDSAAEFGINRWDIFPSIHTSYSLSGTQQIMASYTRRIDRPRGWYLEPFETWSDAFTVRRGNPALKPEYIDSWEIAYQTHIGATLASAEIYHRKTHNKVEFVRSVYRDNISLRTVENVGREYSTGVELMFNANLQNVWDVYLLGNLYDYRVEGELHGRSFAEQTFTWNVRFNNTFTLFERTLLQVNASYNSPSVSAQGRREGYIVTNIAVRQEFFGRRLSAILDIADVLHTAERESTLAGPDFTSWNYYLADGPIVTLTLRYNLSTARNDRERQRPERDDFGTDEF